MKEKPEKSAPVLRLAKNGDGEREPGDATERAIYLCARGREELDWEEYGKALSFFDQTISLDPELVAAWIGRGRARTLLLPPEGKPREYRNPGGRKKRTDHVRAETSGETAQN